MGYEKMPSFRPTYKYYDWRVSLAGMLLCLFIMFYILWRGAASG